MTKFDIKPKLSKYRLKSKLIYLHLNTRFLLFLYFLVILSFATTSSAADFYPETNDILNITLSKGEEYEEFIISKGEEYEEFINFSSRLKYDPYTLEGSLIGATVLAPNLKKILPDRLSEILQNAGTRYDPSVIIIRGLPIDPEIPSFESDSFTARSDAKRTKVSESVIHALAGLMGYCIESVPTEHQGRSIHNITPIKGAEETASSIGRKEFDFHTDDSYSSRGPKFIVLLGLEPDYPNDNVANTSYLFVESFLSTLEPAIIEEMKKPEFRVVSNITVSNNIEGCFPLIQQEGERVRLRFYNDEGRIFATSPTSERVLDHIKEKLSQQKPSGSVILQPGDALIINNGWGLNKPGGVMHARKGYINNPCRWMQRGSMYRKIDEVTQDVMTRNNGE